MQIVYYIRCLRCIILIYNTSGIMQCCSYEAGVFELTLLINDKRKYMITLPNEQNFPDRLEGRSGICVWVFNLYWYHCGYLFLLEDCGYPFLLKICLVLIQIWLTHFYFEVYFSYDVIYVVFALYWWTVRCVDLQPLISAILCKDDLDLMINKGIAFITSP